MLHQKATQRIMVHFFRLNIEECSIGERYTILYARIARSGRAELQNLPTEIQMVLAKVEPFQPRSMHISHTHTQLNSAAIDLWLKARLVHLVVLCRY